MEDNPCAYVSLALFRSFVSSAIGIEGGSGSFRVVVRGMSVPVWHLAGPGAAQESEALAKKFEQVSVRIVGEFIRAEVQRTALFVSGLACEDISELCWILTRPPMVYGPPSLLLGSAACEGSADRCGTLSTSFSTLERCAKPSL